MLNYQRVYGDIHIYNTYIMVASIFFYDYITWLDLVRLDVGLLGDIT